MSTARDDYKRIIFEPKLQWMRKIVQAYVLELEADKAELQDQVQSLMTFLELLVDNDYIKDEGILLLDNAIKKLRKEK